MFEKFESLPLDIRDALTREMLIQVKGFSLEEIIEDYESDGYLFQFGNTSDIYGDSTLEKFDFWKDILVLGYYHNFYKIHKEKTIKIEKQGQIFMI